jgi:hypothetical protein
VGAGPSACSAADIGLRVACNAREGLPFACQYVLALDDIYWSKKDWRSHASRGAFALWPLNHSGPDNHGEGAPFAMPIHPIKADYGNEHLAVKLGDAVVRCQYSGIAATLAALYLTTGPVVLAGFDLHGNDDMGVRYSIQLPAWKAAIQAFPNRVYAHPAMTGPIAAMLPKWHGVTSGRVIQKAEDASPDSYLIVGGGQGARQWLDAALALKPQFIVATNGALQLVANPDWYLATDKRAVEQWREVAEAAMVTHGTIIFSLAGWPVAVPIKYDMKPSVDYVRGQIAHGRSIGCIATQLAINHGAKKVVLVGFDGYGRDDERNYFPEFNRDWESWSEAMNRAMARVLEPLMQDRSDVEFVWFGGDLIRKHFVHPLPQNVEVKHGN